MFAVKASVLRELLADSEWTRRLEKCGSAIEVEQLLHKFCREHHFKVKEIKA